MKIKFEIDDDDIAHEIMEGMFVLMLKNQLSMDQEILDEDEFIHEDDKTLTLKNIAAYEHLIRYYSAPSEMDDD
jgi:hypothetical protein